MDSKTFINSILKEFDSVEERVKKFDEINREIFNKKPSPDSWSAAECIKHLLLINQPYIPQFEGSVKNYPGMNEKINFSHSLMGRFIIWGVKPSTKKKTKTNPEFVPSSSNYDFSLLKEFIDQQKNIRNYIEKSVNLNLKKIKIESPFTKKIKYNLGDAFAIIAYHNQRHIKQAERAISAEEKTNN